MKGTHSHSNRRRWSSAYIVMAIVCCVFGCGILGLMGIHRLRERSSFSLMIKEKDDQIISLHLLLQKERERVAETRRKAEEMRTNIASLGSQKAELSTKVSEMESMISSLREEQRAVESAFQEKYAQMNDQSRLQVEALKEEVRRKEGEIEDLSLRLAAGVGSNATVAEADATQSGGGKSASGETEATNDTSSENEAMRGKEDGAGDQGPEVRGSIRRFRAKRGYLRRAKGRRWRSVGKQAQVRKSDGDSTMAGSALRNSSAEQTHASVEELAESSERKTEGGREQENEQPGDETAEDGNEHQHTDVQGRKGAAERSAEERDVRDADESEDKEETEETEF